MHTLACPDCGAHAEVIYILPHCSNIKCRHFDPTVVAPAAWKPGNGMRVTWKGATGTVVFDPPYDAPDELGVWFDRTGYRRVPWKELKSHSPFPWKHNIGDLVYSDAPHSEKIGARIIVATGGGDVYYWLYTWDIDRGRWVSDLLITSSKATTNPIP